MLCLYNAHHSQKKEKFTCVHVRVCNSGLIYIYSTVADGWWCKPTLAAVRLIMHHRTYGVIDPL